MRSQDPSTPPDEWVDIPWLKLENQVCFALYALSRRVTALYRPLLEPLGLTYPQYLVLLVLWEFQRGVAAEASAGVPVGSLGERLQLDTGTLTPLLKRMESQGWLTRSRGRDDERTVLVRLTAQGLGLRELASQIPLQLLERAGLSLDAASTALCQLKALVGTLQPSAAP